MLSKSFNSEREKIRISFVHFHPAIGKHSTAFSTSLEHLVQMLENGQHQKTVFQEYKVQSYLFLLCC